MRKSWIDEIEKNLERRFEEFLLGNPYQSQLLEKQEEKNHFILIQKRQQEIQLESKALRGKLLNIVKEVKEWRSREGKASHINQIKLAKKAEKYLHQLMTKGRELWEELDQLGIEFRKNKQHLARLSNKKDHPKNNSDQAWSKFEIDQEIQTLRKGNGQKHP